MVDNATGGVHFGGDVDGVTAALVLSGDALDPDAFTWQAGLTPDEAHVRGEPWTGASGRTFHYRGTLWGLESRLPRGATVEQHINGLLERIEPAREAVAGLRAHGCDVQVRLGLFLANVNRGAELTPQTIHRLAELGAGLSLDIYQGEPWFSDSLKRQQGPKSRPPDQP